jgi:hypothetical protein
LLSEHIWSKTNKKYEKLTKTHKIFYRCNQVKSRSKVKCSSACVIILPATSTKAEVHRTTCPHDHIPRNMSVSIEARLAIDKMFEVLKTLKPGKILENLDNANVQIMKENQKRQEDPNLQKEADKPFIKIPFLADLNNYLARYKKKHLINGQANMKLGDLHTWCFEHEPLPPIHELDQVFVVKFHIFYPDENYTYEDDSFEKGDQFRFFLTTQRLLQFSSNFKLILQTDGTYKLLWIGNSVLLIGSSDFDRLFHPIGLACCSREAQ